MKLAMAQVSMDLDMDGNYQKTLDFMKKAKGSDLLFFPEIQWTPFFPQYEEKDLKNCLGKQIDDFCLTLDDQRITKMKELCREYEMYLSPNLYIEQDEKRYDMSLMINSKGELDGFSKMVHILNAKNFYEKY